MKFILGIRCKRCGGNFITDDGIRAKAHGNVDKERCLLCGRPPSSEQLAIVAERRQRRTNVLDKQSCGGVLSLLGRRPAVKSLRAHVLYENVTTDGDKRPVWRGDF